MERCLGSSDAIAAQTARQIEQGLGRSVRGEKDYCVIILTGPDLIKQIRTTASRRFFSAQTRTQIEIGLEIADDARAEGDEPMAALGNLINQCLRRDEGWKEFYSERMNAIEEKGPHHGRLKIFALELKAEERAQEGRFDEAADTIQQLSDQHVTDDAERGWYLQEMARLIYRSSKTRANDNQVAAHKKNRYLLKPREGMVIQKISPLSQRRVDRVIDLMKEFATYENLALTVDELTAKLAFGVDADTFESALDRIGKLLGFACERPDAEWKEGPDNLWCLRDGEYLLLEDKSEALATRAEINKYEAEQMNASVAWFKRNYPGAKSRNLIVHPARKLHGAAAFLEHVEVVRKKNLEPLAKSVKGFFSELKNVDFRDLSAKAIQAALDTHRLGVSDLWTGYADKVKQP